MYRRLLACAALVTAGCAAPPAPSLASIDETTAARCQYVDTVVGSSGWYGVYARQGIENARADALTQAAKAGATSVVWQPMQPTYGVTQIAAKAYRCG